MRRLRMPERTATTGDRRLRLPSNQVPAAAARLQQPRRVSQDEEPARSRHVYLHVPRGWARKRVLAVLEAVVNAQGLLPPAVAAIADDAELILGLNLSEDVDDEDK